MKKKKSLHVLCTECKKIYKFKPGLKPYVGIGFFSGGLGGIGVLLYNHYLIDPLHPKTLSLLIPIYSILFIIGAIILTSVRITQWDCKVCNSKKSLIKLDTPEAIEIIKENNLSFPEELEPKEESKQPWQS